MYQRAKIEVESGSDIYVMFNPSEYNLDASVNYSNVNVPGIDGPITQYISGAQDTLSIQLMFNTYKPPRFDPVVKAVVPVPQVMMEDVSRYTSRIYELTRIKSALRRPPVCTFKWGSLRFKGVVTDVKQKFTMFLDNGKPVRALVDVTFKSVLDLKSTSKASPWGGLDGTTFKILDEVSSLWQVAYDVYQDADKWKNIAKANKISNPLDIVPGMSLKLPSIKN